MTREQIIEALKAASINSRLSCEKAHQIASDLNISLKEIGALCNEQNIKITACRLGCF